MAKAKDETLDLIGTFEAHLILGVERSRIARFLSDNAEGKHKIPDPVSRPYCGPIWHRRQIESKVSEMYARDGSPYGKDRAGLDKWVVERAIKRAQALPKPLTADELSAILGREVTSRQLSTAARVTRQRAPRAAVAVA